LAQVLNFFVALVLSAQRINDLNNQRLNNQRLSLKPPAAKAIQRNKPQWRNAPIQLGA
jgi:hypothetical protein